MGSDKPLVRLVSGPVTGPIRPVVGSARGDPRGRVERGKAYKYDISIPTSTFKEVVDKVRERLIEKGLYKTPGGVKECIGYGHIGDGEPLPPRFRTLTDVYGREPPSECHR
jgi:hypothetical protein